MRIAPAMAVAFGFVTALNLNADEELPAVGQEVLIQNEHDLLHSLISQDAMLVKMLHEQSETQLIANLGITTDRDRVVIGRFQKKRLAFHRTYELNGQRRHVFVYHPSLRRWPGNQPETIIICDSSYRLLDWKEVGGSPLFEGARLDASVGTGPILLLIRRHRHTIPNPTRGIHQVSLLNDRIEVLPEIKWLYENERERAQYDHWRKAIREHQ